MFIKYLIVFILFSVFGFLFEYTFFNKYISDTQKLFNINLPLMFNYGIAAIILLLINKYMKGYSLFSKTIVATIIINIFECLAGLVSYQYNGYQTWNYGKYYSFCNGYISIATGLFWSLLIYIFYYILNKSKISDKF